MSNIKSAQKRIQINKRNKSKNRIYKTHIKNYTKKYFSTIEKYKNNPTLELLKNIEEISNKSFSLIDKALKKGVVHKNTAARKKSQISLKIIEINNINTIFTNLTWRSV